MLLGGVVDRGLLAASGFGIATTSVPPRGTSSSAGADSRVSVPISAWYAAARAYSPRRFATVAPSERSLGRASEAGAVRAVSMPRSTQRRVSSMRRACQARLRREEARGRGAVGPPALFEDAHGGLGFAQRAVDVAGHALGLRQHQARLALQRRVARPLLVLEELERDLRDPGRRPRG